MCIRDRQHINKLLSEWYFWSTVLIFTCFYCIFSLSPGTSTENGITLLALRNLADLDSQIRATLALFGKPPDLRKTVLEKKIYE